MDSCSNLDLDLVPGLPNELVASRILPLLPWYARPVCRAISTSWKSLIDAARVDPVLIDATRAAQIPLLRGAAVVLCVNSDDCTVLKCGDRFHDRDLPPFPKRPRDTPPLVAGSGRIFVWTLVGPKHILKLDVGRGDWHWQPVTTPITSTCSVSWFKPPIVSGSKIYAPCYDMSSPRREVVVFVFDMESDEIEKIPMWDCSGVGSVVSPLGVKDLYGFRYRDAGLVELVRYDRSSNSWSTQERITRPSMSSFMLVNGSCFEPAIETGTNVLSCDFCNTLKWHNSTVFVDEEWIPIQWDDRVSNIYSVRGSLYGWDKGKSRMFKGKIVVESRRVIWERPVSVSDGGLTFNLLV